VSYCMKFDIKVFPANHGDSFLITFGEWDSVKNILVDGGTGRESYRQLKGVFQELKRDGQFIDLLIVTHCDDDHIKGIIDIFEDNTIDKEIIKKVWFNSGSLIAKRLEENIAESNREIPLIINSSKEKSVRQGITLEKELKRIGCWDETLIMSLLEDYVGEAKITVLSPNLTGLKKLNSAWEYEKAKNKEMASVKTDYLIPMEDLLKNEFQEDSRVPNGSSIAFILEYSDKKILMLGDSHPSVVEASLKELGYSPTRKLKVNVLKVSHHGSKYNTSESLLNCIDCENFVISTNGRSHGLPNKECLARIVSTRPKDKCTSFYFNYDLKNVFLASDYEKFNFDCNYLSEKRYTYKLGE
jgi:beta-lactamase superfamily II metal-dependent hydrolase